MAVAVVSFSPSNVAMRRIQTGLSRTYAMSESRIARTEIPARYDSCFTVVSGVVGVEAKEIYLKNQFHHNQGVKVDS